MAPPHLGCSVPNTIQTAFGPSRSRLSRIARRAYALRQRTVPKSGPGIKRTRSDHKAGGMTHSMATFAYLVHLIRQAHRASVGPRKVHTLNPSVRNWDTLHSVDPRLSAHCIDIGLQFRPPP
jgi:hypothetical protein